MEFEKAVAEVEKSEWDLLHKERDGKRVEIDWS
jgi:hypothetical protein